MGLLFYNCYRQRGLLDLWKPHITKREVAHNGKIIAEPTSAFFFFFKALFAMFVVAHAGAEIRTDLVSEIYTSFCLLL